MVANCISNGNHADNVLEAELQVDPEDMVHHLDDHDLVNVANQGHVGKRILVVDNSTVV